VVQAFYIPSGSMQNTLEIGDRVMVNKMVYDFRGIHRGDIVVFDGAGTWDPGAPGAPGNLLVRLWDDLAGVFGSGQGNIYIKRVIGLPGDRVACCNARGQITVNGVPLDESSYLYPGNQSGSGDVRPYSIVVPPESLWVLGDHRAISYDSRGHVGDPGGGAIPEKAVLGRAFVIIWPPSQWNILNIPATFQQPRLSASASAPGGSPAAEIAALDRGVPVRQAWTPLPLALGFAGAVPLAWLQRRVRRRMARRRSAALGPRGKRQPNWWRTLPSEMVQHGYTPHHSAGLIPVAGPADAGRAQLARPGAPVEQAPSGALVLPLQGVCNGRAPAGGRRDALQPGASPAAASRAQFCSAGPVVLGTGPALSAGAVWRPEPGLEGE
jgi:signal peptidase I